MEEEKYFGLEIVVLVVSFGLVLDEIGFKWFGCRI